MKIKNLKIGTQLLISLLILLLCVILLGAVSYLHTGRIHQQTELMYEHPLQVSTAIGEIRTDVNHIHWALETALALDEYDAMVPYIFSIQDRDARIQQNLEILYNTFLGPKESVDQLKAIISDCKKNRDQVFELLQAGYLDQAASLNIHAGTVIESDHLNEINTIIENMSDFAKEKAHSLLVQSHQLAESLRTQLIIVIIIFIAILLSINYALMRTIRAPLVELTEATRRFDKGDMSASSSFVSNNELGILSSSFNTLAKNIRITTELNEKASLLAEKMLREDDAKSFFHTTLQALLEHTGSQMAAVYLLDKEEENFEHFISIGQSENAKASFSATDMEGEFGAVISTHKIQYLKNIPESTRYIFYTVAGKYIPNEIITIPILSIDKLIAIISLSSIGQYRDFANTLVEKIHHTYCARIEGILAYRKMIEFSDILQAQNSELEAQKIELASQSAELTEQNRELEVQKNQLDEANKLKTSFLSNMSHELRTPLNSVIALSGVLNRRLAEQIPEEEHSYLEVIERNGKHLLSLINDILDIARIESGREEIEITLFNICNCIDEVTSMVRPQAEEKSLQLRPVSGDCETWISSDADKIKHILLNLIGNAVKFTESGSISTLVKRQDNTIQISVSDTGIGISEAHLPHIFDEFRQVDGGNARKFGGTGLGLAIAKKYANMLGGTISVSSVREKGSEFILTLPLQYADEKRLLEEDSTIEECVAIKEIVVKPSFGAEPVTILLVEDSEPSIIQMRDFLAEGGYRVLVARDGKEALEFIAETIPDAIILDLMMPGVDGFSVLGTIREDERTAHIPVLILTAKHITKEELLHLKRNNIYQLIQKGDVKRDELMKAVTGMVNPIVTITEKEEQMRRPVVGKPTILVVENNPDNMLTVKALLAGQYNVLEAPDGKEGVDMAVQYNPDLILMDISLPVMDGFKALHAIKQQIQLRDIPVIALTASALTSDREAALAHGFDAFIAKPIDELIFFKTIHEALYGR